MEYRIEILRKKTGTEEAFLQSFLYEAKDGNDTVATALKYFETLDPFKDADGNQAEPVQWECNCLQKKCGACAMVINGTPGLACGARLAELKSPVRLEPLKKFPVIRDLVVDRRQMFENLKEIRLWFREEAGTFDRSSGMAYEASRCLQCGCCLEVCPNFYKEGVYSGMAAAVPMSRLLAKLPESQKKEAAMMYQKHFYNGCGKSLACRNICPAGIDIDGLLVNSNAVAVWKRFFGKKAYIADELKNRRKKGLQN